MPYLAVDPALATAIPEPAPNPAAPLTNVGLTLGAARAELIANLTGRADIPPERYDFWLNRAYIDLATSMPKHDELRASLSFETEEGQPLYRLPDLVTTTFGLARVDEESLAGGVPLEKTDLVWYRRQKDFEFVMERRPSHFFRMNRVLVLWPTPLDTYQMTLDYRYEPQLLTEDDHSPVFRQEWHEAWMILARKKILSAVAEYEAAMVVGNEFTSHMRVRLDREGGEEENKIVSSSVPRSKGTLRRR